MTSSILQIGGKNKTEIDYDPNVMDYTDNLAQAAAAVSASDMLFNRALQLSASAAAVAIAVSDMEFDVASGAPMSSTFSLPAASVAVSPSDMDFCVGHVLTLDAAAVAVTPSDMTELEIPVSAAAVAVTASALTFDRAVVFDLSSAAVSITGTDMAFDGPFALTMPAAAVVVTGSALTFDRAAVLDCAAAAVSVTASAMDFEYSLASFTGPVGDITDWLIPLTDTSVGATSWYWECVHGTLGVVATSTAQHPTFDVREFGRDNYDITLAINGIAGNDATGSFNVIASGDDIYVGSATIAATWSGAAQRITFPIDRALSDAGAGTPLTGTVTVRIFSLDPVVELVNKTASWGDDPSMDWTDSLGFGWSGDISHGGSLSFDADHLDRDVTGYRVQITTGTGDHQRDTNVYQSVIMYPGSSGDIRGGANNVEENVTNMVWTWAEVERYRYTQFNDLSYALATYSDAALAKVATVQSHGVLVLNLVRPDLWWAGTSDPDNYPTQPAGVPYLWTPSAGTLADPLGLTLGGSPDLRTWAQGITYLTDAGYSQHPEDVTLFGVDDTNVKCPYKVILNHTTMTWSVGGAARCKIDSETWWQEWTTQQLACQGGRGVTLDGVVFSHQKIQQRHNASVTPRFADYVRDGTPASSWPNGSNTYDQPAEGVWRLAVGVNYGINHWVATAPASYPAVYDMKFLHVETWRSGTTKNRIRADYRAAVNPAATNAEVDGEWLSLIQDNIDKCDIIICPQIAGNDVDPFTLAWLNTVRAARDSGKTVISEALKPTGQPQVL